jgi:hypothetical protein
MVEGKRPKLAISSPPQHGKSWAATDFIAYVAGKQPDRKTIFGSYSDGSEAAGLANNDWESKNGKYRVFVFGQWHDVPPDAVMTVPNLDGRTLVWASRGSINQVFIRCFLPGAMS